MNSRHTLLALALMTAALSAPSILKLPYLGPFVSSHVRSIAPQMIEELRKDGLWVVHADFEYYTHSGSLACFHWEHQYRGRVRVDPVTDIITCNSQ